MPDTTNGLGDVERDQSTLMLSCGPLDLEVSSWRRVCQTFRVENLMGNIVNL